MLDESAVSANAWKVISYLKPWWIRVTTIQLNTSRLCMPAVTDIGTGMACSMDSDSSLQAMVKVMNLMARWEWEREHARRATLSAHMIINHIQWTHDSLTLHCVYVLVTCCIGSYSNLPLHVASVWPCLASPAATAPAVQV
jgi:hypothetical protein